MKQTLEQAAGADVAEVFERMELTGEYVYTPTAQSIARGRFKAGAEWQKKQGELTWKDIRNIYILIDRIDRKKYPPITVGFYEEILRQFNEIKGSTTITEIETVVQNR